MVWLAVYLSINDKFNFFVKLATITVCNHNRIIMRKALLIIGLIILLVVFLRSSFAQNFFGDAATRFSVWFGEFIEVPERRKIMNLRDQFMRNNMALKPHQVDYVIEITETPAQITKFHALYCIKKDKNPYMYGANLTKLCADIEASELLVSK